MLFVYPRSAKEFSRTRSGMLVHFRIELKFGNVGLGMKCSSELYVFFFILNSFC